jgi:hypothetical protein
MRVFLRHKKTRLYCATHDAWAVAITQARLFNNVPQAARFAFEQEVPEAEIVVRCDLLEQEVALPLLPEWCDLHQPDSAAH